MTDVNEEKLDAKRYQHIRKLGRISSGGVTMEGKRYYYLSYRETSFLTNLSGIENEEDLFDALIVASMKMKDNI